MHLISSIFSAKNLCGADRFIVFYALFAEKMEPINGFKGCVINNLQTKQLVVFYRKLGKGGAMESERTVLGPDLAF